MLEIYNSDKRFRCSIASDTAIKLHMEMIGVTERVLGTEWYRVNRDYGPILLKNKGEVIAEYHLYEGDSLRWK